VNISLSMQHVLLDPQTSGGLIIAVAAERVDNLLRRLQDYQTPCAAIIGEVQEGEAGTILVE
jgi:selenide,water dikinase